MPARISSAITQNAPRRLSRALIPRGFSISKKRKRTNDSSASHTLPAGAASRGIHTPTISSITTRLGSSPQQGISRAVAHVPNAVKTTTAPSVTQKSVPEETTAESANHNNTASKAPAVPGPHGQKPLPKPVPMNVGNIGVLFIYWFVPLFQYMRCLLSLLTLTSPECG